MPSKPTTKPAPDSTRRPILLIYPGTGLDIRAVSVFLPLSVTFLAAALERAGFEARILDLRIEKNRAKKLREELARKPLYVGISAMTGRQLHGGLEAARLARRFSPGTPLVWGGIHPSILPEETLQNPLVDLVVTGRGEGPAVEIARRIALGGEEALRGRVIAAEPEKTGTAGTGASLEIPGNWQNYLTPVVGAARGLAYVSSRGCPHRCTYCYNRAVNRSRWSGDSADSVIEYLKNQARLGIEGVIFFDDNFFVSRERVRKIAEAIVELGLRLKIKADCRADYLVEYDEDFLKLLKRAGFELLYIGAESGSDRMLEMMRKDVTVAQMREANRRLARVGIRPHYSFMAGLPGEEIEDMRATMALMLKLKEEHPGAHLSPVKAYVPYPGTALFDAAVAAGFKAPRSLEEWSRCNWGSRRRAWLDREKGRFVEKMTYVSLGLDTSSVELSGMDRNGFATWGFLKFAGLCRRRCRRPDLGRIPEIFLIRAARKLFAP